jgi:hypothetical protein
MKKQQLLTVMGMFTATGLMMVAIGLLSLPQNPSLSFSFAQLWQQLWDERPLFCWVVTAYFSIMFLCDAWVGIGLIFDNYQPFKMAFFKKKIAKRKISRASSPLGKELPARGGLNIF